jgi:mono/diheme cytochrome c family protein
MRIVLAATMLMTAACGGKKPAPVDATAAAEDAAEKPAEDAAAKAEDGSAASAELIARGEYVAGVAGCALCHTMFGPQGPVLDKMWAGGLEIPEAFGTWRSPNITQDKKTGIGGWSDEEIIVAVREGKRPDGSMLYPIMPYPFYHAMSDGDAKALVAYLRTIAAIENAVAGNTDLKLPKMAMPPATGAEPGDEPLKRGEYLATLAHCAACHTQMGPEGPDMTKFMAGGDPMEIPFLGEGALHAANLTPHPETGIGGWTDAEIVAAVKELTKKDGSPILGPMAMYQLGWAKIPDAEMGALVAYLRSLPPIDNAVPKSTFKPRGPPPDAPPPGDADAGAAPGGDDKADAAP